jgi:hypothetical protein
MDAKQGGVLEHPSGVQLIVPAGALTADATVSLKELPQRIINPESVLFPASSRFVVGLDGGQVLRGSHFELQFQLHEANHAALGMVFRTQDRDGEIRMRRAQRNPTTHTASLNVGPELNLTDEGVRTFEMAHVPALDLVAPAQILAVPYYWQDNLPWCVPTALAMVMNQYENLKGTVSNFALAGADGQWPDEGNSYVSILDSLGVNENLYEYIKWDADLIPDAPFTYYVKMYTHGFQASDYGGPKVFVQPRAPALSSSTTKHAFVGVGASNDSIWLHDSSGAFSGSASIAKKLSWTDFRDIAIDAEKATEVRSLIFFKNPKPASLRRGSIVLEEGSNGSLRYVGPGGNTLSKWQWDGSFWKNGYIWDDPTGTLPQDPKFGNRFKRPSPTAELLGHFDYKLRVANITGKSRGYQLWVFLQKPGTGQSLEVDIHDITVPAYTWQTATITGKLDQFIIQQDGEYEIRFELIDNESGQFQDIKTVGFYVGDGPLAIP